MSFKRSIKEIQELLDALLKAKTVQEKLKRLFMMKVRIELLEAPLKQQRDQKRMAYNRKTRIIKKALKQFLAALDRIYAKHEELGDTAVRDNMYGAILKSFIMPEKTYMIPEQFGMFSGEANGLVRAAIQHFVEHPEVNTARSLLKNPNERLNAFQDYDVKTSIGTNVCEYFGARGGPLA